MGEICNRILSLMQDKLIPKATETESKVFYHKMAGDYYRYIAEFSQDAKKTKASNDAKVAYEAATKEAANLAVTHPIRLGMALNFSVFQYEVLSNPDQACKM